MGRYFQSLTRVHIPQLVRLEEACFSCPWTAQEFERCLGRKHFHAWGILESGELLGYLTFFILVDDIEIVNLAVRKDQRRQGLGQRLLAKLLHLALAQGLQKIVLEVRRSNIAAQHLYLNNGFTLVGERKGYYPPSGDKAREDALVLAWSCSGS